MYFYANNYIMLYVVSFKICMYTYVVSIYDSIYIVMYEHTTVEQKFK